MGERRWEWGFTFVGATGSFDMGLPQGLDHNWQKLKLLQNKVTKSKRGWEDISYYLL